MISHWGVEFPLQNNSLRQKTETTNISKYRVANYAQSYEYHKNKKHKFHSEKYPGLTFDSTWEV